jgi:ABC-type sugar transport system ATPase subunit
MEVSIEQLRFIHGRRTILEIDHLLFAHGTTTALFGPNGSGKTTLLRLIAGLETPTAGRVPQVTVSLAFQRPVFIRGTVRSNLELGLVLRKVGAKEMADRVAEAAQEFGIASLLDRPARALSGGEAQRVNLARALCLRAPVTLLDEPLAGLDRIGRSQLLEELPHLLRTFATTTIIVTHDREEAFRLADHLVVLVEGRVRARGPSGQVYRCPADRLTAELLGYMIVPLADGFLAVPPGGLVPGSSEGSMEMVVERVVDMGNHRDAVGHINGSRVSIRVPDGDAPVSGSRVRVVARGGLPFR